MDGKKRNVLFILCIIITVGACYYLSILEFRSGDYSEDETRSAASEEYEYEDDYEDEETEEDYLEEERDEDGYIKVTYYDAIDYVGEDVKIYCSEIWWSHRTDIEGEPLFINIGEDYPSEDRVQLVIWGEDLYKFNEMATECGYADFETYLSEMGWDCYYAGTVEEYNGVAQITLTDPMQILPPF